jgi:hypothetical protein
VLELLLTDVLAMRRSYTGPSRRGMIIGSRSILSGRRAMTAKDARKAEPALLVAQFVVCVGCWTLVVLALEGAVSRSGFIASIVTGVVLVVITVALVKLGWIAAPVKPAEIITDDE